MKYAISMDPSVVQNIVSELTDLELAVLLALICQEHCVIETPTANVENVARELALICANKFDLSHAILDCSSTTSIDEFHNGILAKRGHLSHMTSGSASSSTQAGSYLHERKIVNVVIAKNFHRTSPDVQMQASELIRSRRIFTRTSTHTTQSTFLFIPVLGFDESTSGDVLLNRHLNDLFPFSHFHEITDGLPNVEEDDGWPSEDHASISSVVRRPQWYDHDAQTDSRRVPEQMIIYLRRLVDTVSLSAEVNRYLHNIVVFLRLNRAVACGISVKATNHFILVAKSLASLHGIDYVSPSIVSLAAKKVYRHRIRVARPEEDRSLQYGSNIESVKVLLKGADSDQIINSVLAEVEIPL